MSTAAKTERLMNLLIMLLVQRHYVPKSRIREILYPDAQNDAFERMFDRDKEDLRSLGVPIEVGQLDHYFEDELGYRIRPDRFALPEIDLTAEEAAVLGLATRVWQHQRLAEATHDAVRKLTAAGVEVEVEALDIARPRLMADEPSFDVFLDALTERSEVAFTYLRSGTPAPSRRRLQPWGITRYSGRWYVVGFDLDRRAERVFRLSRVQGEAAKVGGPGSYEIPADVDIKAIAHRLAPAPIRGEAMLLVRRGTALPLRQAADRVETDVEGPDGARWDRLTVSHRTGLEDEVLGHGANVVVLSPPELRAAVASRLQQMVGP